MRFSFFTSTLLFAGALAYPAESTTQADAVAAANPALQILRDTAARLGDIGTRLNAYQGNQFRADQIVQAMYAAAASVDAAAAQIDAGSGLNIITATSYVPVITTLISQTKDAVEEIEDKRTLFNPPEMAGALNRAYLAVQHLRQSFDNKLPEAFDFLINGLSSNTLARLASARDSFGVAAPIPYGAAPVSYGVPAAAAAPRPYGYAAAPVYGAVPVYQ